MSSIDQRIPPNEGAVQRDPPFGGRFDPKPIELLREQIGDEAVAAVVGTFRAESRQRAGVLRASAAAGYVEVVRREAHTLKSAAAALGACDMSESCARLEAVCRDQGRIDAEYVARALEATEQALGLPTAADGR